jgi:WD40 repeat protein
MVDALRRTQMRRFGFFIPVSQVDAGRRLAAARLGDVYLWDTQDPDTIRRVVPPGAPEPQDASDPASQRRGRDRNERNPRTDRGGGVGSGPGGPGGAGGRRGGPMWTAVALDPRGAALYLLDFESRLHAWSLTETPEGLIMAAARPWSATMRGFSSIALSPDGKTLACGTEDGHVRFLDPVGGADRGGLPLVDDEVRPRITSLAFSPDGHLMAVGDQQGGFDLWQIRDVPMHTHAAQMRCATRLLRFPAHVGAVGPITFDREGLRLASTGDDKFVQVWELDRIERSLDALQLGWSDAIGASGAPEHAR